MKKSLVTSYITGVTDTEHGEQYGSLFGYFVPEFITTLVLYSLPIWIDAYFIGQLESTSTYAALGSTNNLLHLLVKTAEAFSIGTVILAGYHNGIHQFEEAGKTIRDAFWTTLLLGSCISLALFFGAPFIYHWYGVSSEVVSYGVPFLRLRAVGIFFTFLSLAFIGFLRGIKNTRAPMKMFIVGAFIFIIFDYALIFGKFGFPQLGLQGSAWATMIQYGFISAVAMFYVLFNHKYRKYAIDLFSLFKGKTVIRDLVYVSWPVICDKATLAMAYIWLGKMIAPMGTSCVATFCIIKDMERFAFLPAIACAQVITFLVSNDYGSHNWLAIKTNIKKITFIASVMVFTILLTCSVYAQNIVALFDKKGEFTPLAVKAFPLISMLVICDIAQLILSGALRGAGNVKTVMLVRFAVCFGFFIPVSYIVSHLAIKDELLKFILIYGSFYLGNGLMSIAYIHRFRSTHWNKVSA